MEGIFGYPAVFILNVLGQVLDSYLYVNLIGHFFPAKHPGGVSKKQEALSTLVMAALLLGTDIFSGNNFFWYYGMMLLLPLLYAMLFFQEKLTTKVILCSLFTSFIISAEQMVMTLAGPLGNDVEHFGWLLFWFFLRRIVLKVALLFLARQLFIWPGESNISLPTGYWGLTLLVSGATNFLLTFFRTGSEQSAATFLLRLYLFLVPIVLLLVVKNLSVSAHKAQVSTAQMEFARTQNQYLSQQIGMMESLRKFRHDYKSHLFAMDALLAAGKYEELHQYLLSLHQYQYEGIHLRRFTDDEALNILLNQKATMAEKAGISFDCEVSLPPDGKIPIMDLSSLIVNLLDNAIEACATLPEARIRLRVHKSKAYLVFEESNTCKENILEKNPLFRTRKKNPEMHGMGIKIIRSITQKYHGKYEVKSTDSCFTTTILLLDE